MINTINHKIVCNDFFINTLQLSVPHFLWLTHLKSYSCTQLILQDCNHPLSRTPVYAGYELFYTCGSDRNILCAVYTGR